MSRQTDTRTLNFHANTLRHHLVRRGATARLTHQIHDRLALVYPTPTNPDTDTFTTLTFEINERGIVTAWLPGATITEFHIAHAAATITEHWDTWAPHLTTEITP